MGDKAAALTAEVATLLAKETPDVAKATEKAKEALALCKESKSVEGQIEAYRGLVSAKLADDKDSEAKAEARKVASEAVEALAGDAKGQAAAKLLLSEICLSTLKKSEALAAAKEAYALSKGAGDDEGMAAALEMVVSAELTSSEGEAVGAAKEAVEIYKRLGKADKESGALLLLAQVHVTRIGLKLATCAIASCDDSLAALQAAKDANAMFVEQGDRDGMQSCLDLMTRVLMYNGVPGHVLEKLSDPEDIFQDVISAKYSTATNGLPARSLSKNLKVEEIIPSSKQLERGKFTWTNPLAGYCYTMMWQAAKERNIPNKQPRGSYDIMALNSNAKTSSVSTAFTAMSNDAADRNTSMVVYMTSHDGSSTYATNMITQTSVMACMITARLAKLVFVQFGEAHVDWTDVRCRQVNIYPVTLALIRSCRIEAPVVNIGYVAGDACSWVADPAPLVESLFDTLESDECELMYKRGEAFAPLLIHRAMDDGVSYVKPKRGANFMK